jgi:hypothetical protein
MLGDNSVVPTFCRTCPVYSECDSNPCGRRRHGASRTGINISSCSSTALSLILSLAFITGERGLGIARRDPREQTPQGQIKDIAAVPFACRALTFDGGNF